MSLVELIDDYLDIEMNGRGTKQSALLKIERETGVKAGRLDGIHRGKIKPDSLSLFKRIRLSYLKACKRKAAELEVKKMTYEALGHDLFETDDWGMDIGAIRKEIERKIKRINSV